MLRQPAVAGQFYPAEGPLLKQQVSGYLEQGSNKRPAVGVVSPHAGYIYSGSVAGQVFSQLEIPRQVILLGPNHHGLGHRGAVWSHGAWLSPLGEVPVARSLAEELLASCPQLAEDHLAHRHEHSLEVQLPFLQLCRPDLEIVPVCLGHLSLTNLIDLGERLGAILKLQGEVPLIVASSDMTHYEPGKVAREKDYLAIERVLAIDPEGLYQTVSHRRISMCGVLPTVVMLAAARLLGATGAELVAYSNSGDVTGDQSEVVGYAGIALR